MGDKFDFQVFGWASSKVRSQPGEMLQWCLSLRGLMINETAPRVCPIEDCGEEAHAHAYRGIEMHLSPLVFLPERLVGVRQTEDQCSAGMLLADGEEYLQDGSREGASSFSQLISICSEASILRHTPEM